MTPETHVPLTDDELHALADDQVPAAALAGLRVRLAHDPAAQQRLAQWQLQRARLQGLHRDVLQQAVPQALEQAASRVASIHTASSRWRQLGGMAASVALAFGLGWLSHTGWQSGATGAAGAAALARAQMEQTFVQQAGLAHAVYTPEVKHPVEVTAQDQSHLVQWLSKRLGRPLKVPDLSASGFNLVGGRLLPGELGARAQFMYQNRDALRVTLYLGALEPSPSSGLSGKETSFRFETQAAVPSFYWVDQGFGYALSGRLAQSELLQLAQAVYHQL